MNLTYNAISHRGLVRDGNEDCILVGNQVLRDNTDNFSFGIPDAGIIFPALVCDGVGGHARGEEASLAACDDFRSFFETLSPDLDDNYLIMLIKQAATRCNSKIIELAAGCGMATTMTGLLIYGNHAFILNAGDSRTYRMRYENFKQMTAEHTIVRDGKRYITNCFGLDDMKLDVTPTAIVPGDIFVICSDGLFDMVPDNIIAENCVSAERLLALALEAGGRDNTSLITLQFTE